MPLDRLSSLISRFTLAVAVCPPGEGNLRLLADVGSAGSYVLEFLPGGGTFQPAAGQNLVAARVDFGGSANPLISALPPCLRLLPDNPETDLLLQVFVAEAEAARCGSEAALGRLAEVLLIHLFRYQIEQGTTTPGLLAGLADPRLSRALVAIHDRPGISWKNQDLAKIAGMSASRFADIFRITLNETPQSYLRRWRLTLARQDIRRGDRISTIANRYGYASAEALSHAFNRQYGCKPTACR